MRSQFKLERTLAWYACAQLEQSVTVYILAYISPYHPLDEYYVCSVSGWRYYFSYSPPLWQLQT